MTDPRRVGFIGLGAMGWPMASNLVCHGVEVTVYDRDAEREERFAAEQGGSAATGPADFATVSILITMLPDDTAVGHVARDWEGGLLSALAPGTVLVDMSSSNPRATKQLAEDAGPHEVAVVDAPVSGGVSRAEDATLSIMVGADDEAFATVEPTLRLLGRTIFRTGPVGSGHAMKALNNAIGATAYAAVAEAIEVGRAYALDPATIVDVVNESTGRSFTSEVVYRDHVIPGRYATGFALGLLAKDAGIADNMATSADVRAPVFHLVAERWGRAEYELGFSVDHSRAHAAWW